MRIRRVRVTGPRRAVGLAVVAVLAIGTATVAPAFAAGLTYSTSFSYVAPLERAPYVTDLTQTSAVVNWATSKTTPGYATWGPSGNCTAHTVAGTNKLPPFTPVSTGGTDTTDQIKLSTSDYQTSVQLTGLSAGQSYCYETFTSSNVNLLGPGVSQSFSTLDATSSTAPLTFDVVGDYGETNGADESPAFVNEDQAAIDDLLGTSGAKFILSAGDVAYSGGTNANYGDLTKPPTSATNEVSNVFGPAYWPQTTGIPVFASSGNHGQNIDGLRTWPEETTAAASGGAFDYTSYVDPAEGVNVSAPNTWYAFSDGGVRIYVLDASWKDSTTYLNTTKATGSLCTSAGSKAKTRCGGYELDDAEHWRPSSGEMRWLQGDLAAHPGGIKMAVFHYPLVSDNATQPSDPYLQRDLAPVLEAGGVQLAFNGHAHTYQRFSPVGGGLISYVTGGGGGTLEPVQGGSTCTSLKASYSMYAIGHSSKAGSSCGQSVPAGSSLSPAAVYHFLKVTVNGSSVTVTPVNALGQSFDVQTYDLGTSGTGSTTTTSTTTTSTTSTTQGGSGVSPVQSASSTTTTVTLPNPTTAGDTLVLTASLYTGTSGPITAVSDGTGDSWHQAARGYSAGHNSDGELWYAANVPAGITSVTVTTTAKSDALQVEELSGLGASPTVQGGASSSTGTSATQTQAGTGLAVGFVAGHANIQTIAPVSGWSSLPQVTNPTTGAITTLVTGTQAASGTATYGGSWGKAMYWAAGVAVFTPG